MTASNGHDDYPQRISELLESLAIPPDVIAARALPLQPEASELVVAEIGGDGREYLLVPPAAEAWRELRAMAASDGVILRIVSAFRSADRQADIVRAKLARGVPLAAVLEVSSPPGYSEHHSGRAVDIATDGVVPLEEAFEQTAAFEWLTGHAGRFGFFLSYPRGNPEGYAYEPWHWCYRLAVA